MVLLTAFVTMPGKFRQYGGAIPAVRIQEATVSHFDGPLSLDVNRDLDGTTTQKFVAGSEPLDLNVMIGTFDPKNGCWVVIENSDMNQAEDFPDELHPMAEVEFATGQAEGEPIRVRNSLTQRC